MKDYDALFAKTMMLVAGYEFMKAIAHRGCLLSPEEANKEMEKILYGINKNHLYTAMVHFDDWELKDKTNKNGTFDVEVGLLQIFALTDV